MTDAEAEIGYYQGDGLAARRCAARAGSAGAAAEGHVPGRLQGLVPAVRQEFERGTVFLLDELEDPRWAALKEIATELELKSSS